MEIIKPGEFGTTYTADAKRREFDFGNHQIISEGKKVDFVFIGDSITDNCDLNLYYSDLGFVVNRGIGGDISTIIAKRFEADALQLNPKKIICLIGCNDLMTMHYDHWWRKEGNPIDKIVSEYEESIKQIMEMSKGRKLIMCSVLPTDICIPFDKKKMNDGVVTLNNILKKYCKEYNQTYVDFHSALTREDGLTMKDGLTYDGIHPNPSGYRIMVDILRPYLNL